MEDIILEKRHSWSDKEYVCELTDFINEKTKFPLAQRFGFYIYDIRDVYENALAIRIPGGTVGCVMLDNNDVIVKCEIYEDKNDINEKLKRFVGSKIIFKQENN